MEASILTLETVDAYIEPKVDVSCSPAKMHLHKQMAAECLKTIFPDIHTQDDWKTMFTEATDNIPYVKWVLHTSMFPMNMSFFLFCSFRNNAFKFFYDIITRWLIPGSCVNAELFYALDFSSTLRDDNTLFSIGELVISIDDPEDLSLIQKNLPIIETEIRLGAASEYYARTILGIKGLSTDDKTTAIQERIVQLLNRRPKDFDYDIFSEMQHVLLLCHDEFKHIRRSGHISKIISSHYLYRRSIRDSLQKHPNKRHLHTKCIRSTLYYPQGVTKSALGIVVAMNFLDDSEIFEERHFSRTITSIFPTVKIIKNSFIANFTRSDSISTMYLEIEKADETEFTTEEVRKLRSSLSSDLCNRIEHITHPIFMPSNEEEIMRNILTLSNQLKYVKDLPQVIISFSEQKRATLSFTIIFARILRPGYSPIHVKFNDAKSFLKYIPDRTKKVGILRKKYPKECSVFRVEINKSDFLRNDHSLDLTKARQAIVVELCRVLGDFRDFNGGIISKQNELLNSLKSSLLQTVGKQNEFLLENFFYSLNPAIARTLLDIDTLKTLFLMLCESIESNFFKGFDPKASIREMGSSLFVMITAQEESTLRESLHIALDALQITSMQLISTQITSSGMFYLGFIFRSDDMQKKRKFIEILHQATVGDE